MSKILQLLAGGGFQSSDVMKRMAKHRGDVSEGSKANVLARRTVLGRRVTFYKDGSRRVKGIDLNDTEAHYSDILSKAHASLLENKPVGDKAFCYVDARKNPVEVILYGQPAGRAIQKILRMIELGLVDPEKVLNTHIKDTIVGV